MDPPRLIHFDSTKERPILNLYLSGPDENRKKDEYSWLLKNNLEKVEDVLQVELSNYKKRNLQSFYLQKRWINITFPQVM